MASAPLAAAARAAFRRAVETRRPPRATNSWAERSDAPGKRRTRAGERKQGLGALTGRELEVAQLIRGHGTNREIASELFLSLKTVETHIRHIVEKLAVTSRAEVAWAVEAAAG